MYQVIMTTMQLDTTGQDMPAHHIEEVVLGFIYPSAADANRACKRMAEAVRGVKVVHHHAGVSVAWLGGGKYQEFHRSARLLT